CHNRKRTVELNLTTPYSETNFAVRFRVVCLLLTTSGEVVSFLSRITKKEIYMTKEEFVSYIFDKTVEMYAVTYGSCNPLNKPEGKDDFDKIYRFLEDRYIKRLEDAGIKSPVKSPLS
ncbi:hypothetical protein ACTC6A_004994, partial [Escherichia albertii]|nr:hypothetical protein [Escherichia albertii]MCZ8912111.1 hypothetical protein [Escherichia albertii]MCZ8935523.1 hypothetical protein [Escherichia albertii]MCZ8945207.1 hypothetical protein [Escherichia albertii]MCZ9085104.1 hypothetical protein [Escherichia albertii]